MLSMQVLGPIVSIQAYDESDTSNEEVLPNDSSEAQVPANISEKGDDKAGSVDTFKVTNVSNTNQTYTISYTSDALASMKEVSFAMWSSTKGQDDLKWAVASKNANTWTYNLQAKDFKSTGQMEVHIYAKDSSGKSVFITKDVFTIENTITAKTVISNVNNTNGTATITVTPTVVTAGVKTVSIPVWSKSDQSDLVWYQAVKQANGTYVASMNVKNHANNVGTYNIHTYVTNNLGTMVNTSVQTVNVNAAVAKMEIAPYGSQERYYDVTISDGINTNNNPVLLAVWSTTNGQDDLRWETTTNSSNEYTHRIDINKYKTPGEYNVHAYVKNTNGTMTFISKDTFSVNNLPSVTVSTTPATLGYEVIIEAESTTSITSMLVPVWTTSNQSDLVWYTATALGNNTFKVNIIPSNHKNLYTTYNIHVYTTMSNGIFACSKETTYKPTLNVESFTITNISNKSENYSLSLASSSLAPMKEVMFAIWSTTNGQDDLKWVSATRSSNTWGSTIAIKDFKSTGNYIVHAYAKDSAGNQVFVAEKTFTVTSTIEATTKITNINQSSGNASVVVTPTIVTSGVKSVSVAVWSKSNQSDLVWYSAIRQANGTYVASIDAAKHGYNSGTYQVHSYVANNFNDTKNTSTDTVEFTLPENTVAIKDKYNNEIIYQITTTTTPQLAGNNVSIAVWSEVGGQDDLIWYSGNRTAQTNVYTTDVAINNHKTGGNYIVHVYAQDGSGKTIQLAQSSFTVSTPSAKTTVTNINPETGTFNVNVEVTDAPAGVDKVNVALWTTSNQSNLAWYEAKLVSGNIYSFTANVNNHENIAGIYHVHTYISQKNGTEQKANEGTAAVSLSNHLGVYKVSDGKYRATLTNIAANATKVDFAVWSQVNGQDDLAWYEATKSGNVYYVDIDTTVFGDPGTFELHAYMTVESNQSLVKKTTFSVSQSEVYSPAKRYIQQQANTYMTNLGTRDLHTLFDWVANNVTYVENPTHVIARSGFTREETYAAMGFESLHGNCYVSAAMFAAFARELGYDAKYIEGGVLLQSGYANHGFVEITINGTSYICDPEMQGTLPQYNLYMQPKSNTILTYRYHQ